MTKNQSQSGQKPNDSAQQKLKSKYQLKTLEEDIMTHDKIIYEVKEELASHSLSAKSEEIEEDPHRNLGDVVQEKHPEQFHIIDKYELARTTEIPELHQRNVEVIDDMEYPLKRQENMARQFAGLDKIL